MTMTSICKRIFFAIYIIGSITAGTSSAAVYLIDTPKKWKDGNIEWYLNIDKKPANVTTDEVVAAIKAGFSRWEAVCNIKSTYKGVTSESSTAPIPQTKTIVEFYKGGSSWNGGPGGNSASNGSIGYFSSGGITVAADDITDSSALTRSIVTFQHEIGHLIGLHHSDEPFTAMFAGPYSEGSTLLQGDDIHGCAKLYGSRGVVLRPDHRLETPKNKYVSIAFADGNGLISGDYDWTQRSGLSAEGYTQTGTFVLKPFSTTMLNDQDSFFTRMIAPNGTTISETGASPTSMINSFLGGIRNAGRTPMNGEWTFQTVINDVVDASRSFRVVNGFDKYTADRLEFSLVAEQSTAGDFSARLDNITNIGIERVSSSLNDRILSTKFNGAGAPFATFTPEISNQSTLSVWVKTNQERYTGDLAKGFGGNEGDTFNVIRQVKLLTDTNGKLIDNRIELDETGTNHSYFAEANIQSAQSGQTNAYVAVLFNNRILFRGKSGWTETPIEIVSFNGPAAVNINLLTAFDVSQIPTGASLYVGYGNTIEQMIAKSQFKLLKVF